MDGKQVILCFVLFEDGLWGPKDEMSDGLGNGQAMLSHTDFFTVCKTCETSQQVEVNHTLKSPPFRGQNWRAKLHCSRKGRHVLANCSRHCVVSYWIHIADSFLRVEKRRRRRVQELAAPLFERWGWVAVVIPTIFPRMRVHLIAVGFDSFIESKLFLESRIFWSAARFFPFQSFAFWIWTTAADFQHRCGTKMRHGPPWWNCYAPGSAGIQASTLWSFSLTFWSFRF